MRVGTGLAHTHVQIHKTRHCSSSSPSSCAKCQAYEKEITELKDELKEVREAAEKDAARARQLQEEYEGRIKESQDTILGLGEQVGNLKQATAELER